MRGTLAYAVRVPLAERITPAGAGKTVYRRDSLHLRKDHPRRCGENRALQQVDTAERGSPPQVRGKRRLKIEIVPCCGITPAGAGKTFKFPQNPIDK